MLNAPYDPFKHPLYYVAVTHLSQDFHMYSITWAGMQVGQAKFTLTKIYTRTLVYDLDAAQTYSSSRSNSYCLLQFASW